MTEERRKQISSNIWNTLIRIWAEQHGCTVEKEDAA